MPKKRTGYDFILKEDFNRLADAEKIAIHRSLAEYTHKVRIVSALDAAVHHTWSKPDAPVKVVERNRFPSVNGSTPDFMFRFSNGYVLIGEYKASWARTGHNNDDLSQLSRYRTLNCRKPADSIEHPPTQSHDVMLIVGNGTDENAADAIAGSTLPGLGSNSVVIVDAHVETQAVSGEWIRFVYRRHGGSNGRFTSVNAGPENTQHDLNHWFADRGSFPARFDANAMALAGECPFINDTPPAIYCIACVILPGVNATLSDGDRDALATGGRVRAKITVQQVMDFATPRFPRVPKEKLSSWCTSALDEMQANGLARSLMSNGEKTFEIELDERLDRLSDEKLADKLAKGQLARRYVTMKRLPNSDQFAFDFD